MQDAECPVDREHQEIADLGDEARLPLRFRRSKMILRELVISFLLGVHCTPLRKLFSLPAASLLRQLDGEG